MATTAHERKPAPTFDSVTSQIALTQTRRFSQKSVIEASRPAPKANPFANLAPAFIGGLLGRWGGNRGAGMERGYDVLQRAPVVLLQKFVMTLGVLLYYSGNSTHLMAMTRELFQFFLALRYSIPPSQTAPPMAGLGNSPVMISDSLTSMLSTVSGSSTPAITSLKLPGDGSSLSPGVGGGGYGSNSRSVATGSQYDQRFNKDLVESILFGLLIMVTPSTSALPDELMVGEFYPEIMECQQWSMELWEEGQLSQGGAAEGGGKATMYCAALLQRCFELLKIDL
ncbi:hypothetical protein BGW38_003930 [Lunasporangiospora selenospora]|uniref:Uncharacterized protein n=1 Tax=Lunasporangiospora selenospora TaxID=979761 RepID=A0A9P6KCD6_9FUNG|nr:hypothetical protein BGW38_003930 [Lunasporangiospora selenospora]